MNVALFGNGDFEDVIKDPEKRRLCWINQAILHAITNARIRERQREIRHTETKEKREYDFIRKRDMKMLCYDREGGERRH